jgi:uncharacterized protein YcaQ
MAADVLAFIRARGPTHPRDVEAHFAHGRRINAWGGSGLATTHLLDGMHYRGLLRIQRRDSGTRIYAAVEHPPADADAAARAARAVALLELVVRKYAPLPGSSLVYLARLLRYGAPHLQAETRAALAALRERLASVQIGATTWYWPADENPRSARHAPEVRVRLLAPFDPIVWDRRRFELLWGWTYRFEAYTPADKRTLGYYALPLLWRDRAIGWANIARRGNEMIAGLGYVSGRAPRDRGFKQALERELDAMRVFLEARAK